MKKLLAFVLLVCVLLVGCGNEQEPADSVPDANATTTVFETVSTTEYTTVPTEETTATTAASDEPQSTMMTVYLLDTEMYVDSGKMTFEYDGAHNLTSAVSWTIENEMRYITYFEEHDENGMPCKIREVWPEGMVETYTVSYFADGKIDSYQYDGMNFSGYQCAYDQKGDLSEKREYYDGILESTVVYKYDGETLSEVYCEDPDGNLIYDTVVEDGRIALRNILDFDYPCGYRYEYDEHGNLIASYFAEEDMEYITSQYTYKAVEVDYNRALCLMQQQKLILSIV